MMFNPPAGDLRIGEPGGHASDEVWHWNLPGLEPDVYVGFRELVERLGSNMLEAIVDFV